jgi:hypothetical protein
VRHVESAFPADAGDAGENTLPFYALISEAIAACVPGAQQITLQGVNHNAPVHDPAAFTGCAVRDLVKALRGLVARGTACDPKRKLLLLFNHLEGGHEERRGDRQTERLGCLKVDHQVEFGRLFDR